MFWVVGVGFALAFMCAIVYRTPHASKRPQPQWQHSPPRKLVRKLSRTPHHPGPLPHMNIAKCVQLHNELVRFGWTGAGRSLADFRPRSWFDAHGPAAAQVRALLTPDTTAFLEQAYKVEQDLSLHYFVFDLNHPDNIISILNGLWDHDSNRGRYLTLYAATSYPSHPLGLIFDQETNTAIMAMSLWDTDGLDNGRIKWYPLKTVLETWLDMVYKGKVKAEPPGLDGNHTNKFDPWVLLPYTNRQVEEAVGVFNVLVEAIEIRMPELPPNYQKTNDTLLNQDILAAAQITPGFAFDFLAKARLPRFHFIAPGLEVPSRNSIASQPFFGMMDTVPEQYRDENRTPPLLLFRSSLAYNRPPPSPKARWQSESIFGYPFNASAFPAGLYFHAGDLSGKNDHDDQVSLVLPYAMGSNGWARKSDGTLFGENINDDPPKAMDMPAELYQPGHQPFIDKHAVRLVKVLQSWLAMVERGDWEVGKDGVANGINEWKQADTRGGWEKYYIPPDW